MDNATFITIWRTWDTHCQTDNHYYEHDSVRCNPTDRFEDACQEKAAELGITWLRLRTRLQKGRQAGLSYEDSLTAVSAVHDLV